MKLSIFLIIAAVVAVCFAEKVKLEIFYESLCPYCQNFINKQLLPILKTDFANEVEVRMYPFGNVEVQPDGSFACQHGEPECALNKIQACALHYYHEIEVLEFIACLESSQDNTQKCADEWLGPDSYNLITDCVEGQTGTDLMSEIKKISEKEQYYFVPWIVINGEQSMGAQGNLAAELCEHMKYKPAICNEIPNFRRVQEIKSGVTFKSFPLN